VPEAILYSRVDMAPQDWNDWRATEGVEVLRPRQHVPLLCRCR
jgi:hypothetical protein